MTSRFPEPSIQFISTFHQKQMFGHQHCLVALIQHFKRFHNDAVLPALRIVSFLLDMDSGAYGVVQEYRLHEAEAVISITHGARINLARGHAHGNTEDKGPVRHSPTKRLCSAPLSVHVVGIKVARLSRMKNHISLRDRSGKRLTRNAGIIIFEENLHTVLPFQFAERLSLTLVKLTYHPVSRMKITSQTDLAGITWNHTRGYVPMVATAQRFAELNPGVIIRWEKRSLQQFADFPLEKLASEFDLLVIDHPSIGEAAELGLLIPLEQHLDPEFLSDQSANTVGQSHASYQYEGHQYALAIDAATPIAGWRADLLERAEAEVPRTWEELLSLARRGLVTVPAIPIDSLMHLFMLSNALGGEPFSAPGEVLPAASGAEALSMLRELVSLSAPGSLDRNPIATWQLLAESNEVAYCPFAYGYSNYSRAGYARHIIQTGPLVTFRGRAFRSTLGGAGLAISAKARNLAACLSYAQYVASPHIQRTLYTASGGQPGHRAAWTDDEANRLTNQFFRSTLSTLDGAWVRPRFAGFIAFQDRASAIVHRYLQDGGDAIDTLHQLNNTLQFSRETLR